MRIGDIIRKYRKENSLTQEEVAKRLGVTAPAVNKWENGYSMPDISLLSPIARLLNISTDTLLSHTKNISDEEANRLVEQALERLKKEPYEDVFQWMKECIAEYPNSYFLLLWMARVFDSQRQMLEIPDGEKYDAYLLDCYKRVLESEDEGLRSAAAEALYYFYMNKERYEDAEQYLTYFSNENPERKRKQAMICSKTGRVDEAHKMLEELLYAGYQSINDTFRDIYFLALEEKDQKQAHMLVEKMQQLARLFEFGKYHEISSGLELATLEKDEEHTITIMEQMLTNIESLVAFTKSPLYAHMQFKETDNTAFLSEVRHDLLKGFQDKETYGYLENNQRWKDLVGASSE